MLCLVFILSGIKKYIMKTECEKKNYLQSYGEIKIYL